MKQSEAEAVLEQLLEVLDERYEAGPTTYVVNRATVEPTGTDQYAVVVVFRRTADGPLLTFTADALVRVSSGEPVSAEQLGWDIYQVVLEGGGGEVSGADGSAVDV
ncbi:MAG: hypothetical protein QOJ03_3036 [Frankiaceae bacterium]|nr:hypothetical protein [Frankiaceae bacterium]